MNEFGGSDGQILVFDDSKLHLAFNKSDEERLVLIIDMARPDELSSVSQTSAKLCQSQRMEMCTHVFCSYVARIQGVVAGVLSGFSF